ncbi:MAG: sporulation protein YqfD [Bacilli bacterium]|nr:sporulation protein YqfD [Bacilli bacterium]
MNSKYQLKITGKNPKRFLKDLIKLKISLYHMENHDKYSIIIVDGNGLNEIRKLKTSYQIRLVREYGYIKYKHLLKKYIWFLLSLVLSIIIIEGLSNVVFSVEVEHSKKEIRELILNDLETYGIKKYHFRVSYQKKEQIKKKILAKETDRIEWLEIERVGTKYIVSVEERIKNEGPKNRNAQNIIAKKDAMILRINATSGEVVKKRYDYVKKGDILISGFITRDEKIVSKTRADGKVFGEVWYKVNIDLPKKYQVINKTGKRKKKIELKIFDKSLFLFELNQYKTYQVQRKTIIKNPIIPLGIYNTTIHETKEISKNYNHNNASQEAMKIASRKLLEKLGDEDRIISKKVLKKTEKNSRIIVEVFFKVEEDIRDTENIENIKIEDIEGEKSEPSN